jgi:hypothetical protein
VWATFHQPIRARWKRTFWSRSGLKVRKSINRFFELPKVVVSVPSWLPSWGFPIENWCSKGTPGHLGGRRPTRY